MLGLASYREHKINDYMRQHVNVLAGHQGILLSTIKHRKSSSFDHVCRRDTLPKTILHGTVEDSRRRERPWKDNDQEWTDQSLSLLLRIADDRN